jgi:hypothetical protein
MFNQVKVLNCARARTYQSKYISVQSLKFVEYIVLTTKQKTVYEDGNAMAQQHRDEVMGLYMLQYSYADLFFTFVYCSYFRKGLQ